MIHQEVQKSRRPFDKSVAKLSKRPSFRRTEAYRKFRFGNLQ